MERKRGSGKRQLFVVALLGFASFFLSIYMTYDHIKDEKHSFCDIGRYISCSRVRRSVFSELFQVPVAVFGILYNIANIIGSLSAIQLPPHESVVLVAALFYWNILGTAFVFYLIAGEVFLATICPFCTLVHLCQLASMWILYGLYNKQQGSPSLSEVLWQMRGWIILIALSGLIPLVLFNFSIVGVGGLPGDETPVTNEQFAECLTQEGWRFYGMRGCGWCKKQKQLFGPVLDHIYYIDCAQDLATCRELDIEGYPTWIRFDEEGEEIKRARGYVSLQTWHILTDCEFPYKALRAA